MQATTRGVRVPVVGPRARAVAADRRRDRVVRGARRTRDRRTDRPARGGAGDRAHGPGAGHHQADGAQRRAGRGVGRPSRGQRRLRAVHRRRVADRAPGDGDRADRPAVGGGRGLRGRARHVRRRDDRARDPGRRGDARPRRRLLRADGAARHLRRRDPRRARDAVAAVAAEHPAALAAGPDGVDDRPARVLGRRRRLRRVRAGGRGLAGVRWRGARVRRRGGRLPAAERRVRVALPPGRPGFGQLARAADRDRHRPAQPRRGRGHRRRLFRRRAGARRLPGDRLRDPQHHRGSRHRRAHRQRARVAAPPGRAGRDRGRARRARGVDRRGAPTTPRSPRSCSASGPARSCRSSSRCCRRCATTTDASCTPAPRSGCSAGSRSCSSRGCSWRRDRPTTGIVGTLGGG